MVRHHEQLVLWLALATAEESAVNLAKFGFEPVDAGISLLQTQARRANISSGHRLPPAFAVEVEGLFAGANHRTEGFVSRSMMSDEQMRGLDRRRVPEWEDGSWTYNVPSHVKIVSWTGNYGMGDRNLPKVAPKCEYVELPHTDKDLTYIRGKKATCDWEFVISDPDTDISDVDVVLFYLPYIMRTDWRKSMPTVKKPGQMWIGTCGEPMWRPETMMDCRLANDEEFMARMDGVASYHPTAEFPAYLDPPNEDLMRTPTPDFAARGNELATVTFSDCDATGRAEWLEAVHGEFKKKGHSDVLLSYGRCLHNAEEPSKECIDNAQWYDCWSNRCSSRPFKFVGENVIEPWYVTEKVWDALWEGAIPIYWGPPEVKYLVPPDSIIFWQDYETPAALVEAVLSFTDADFHRMRAWKSQPVAEWGNYTEIRRLGQTTLLPRLCEAAAAAKAKAA